MKNLLKGITTKVAILSLPLLAMAAGEEPLDVAKKIIETGKKSKIGTVSGTFDLINNVFSWILGFGILFGVVFLILAGVGYMQAGGDPEKIKKAKGKLIYAIVGVAVVVVAKAIVALAANLFGVEYE